MAKAFKVEQDLGKDFELINTEDYDFELKQCEGLLD